MTTSEKNGLFVFAVGIFLLTLLFLDLNFLWNLDSKMQCRAKQGVELELHRTITTDCENK